VHAYVCTASTTCITCDADDNNNFFILCMVQIKLTTTHAHGMVPGVGLYFLILLLHICTNLMLSVLPVTCSSPSLFSSPMPYVGTQYRTYAAGGLHVMPINRGKCEQQLQHHAMELCPFTIFFCLVFNLGTCLLT